MYLKRYCVITISPSGVWNILERLDLNRLPSSQRYKRHKDRWKRYEKALPGHRVQVDVKFIEPLLGSRKKFYQYTAIDDCTRIRVLRIYPRNNQKSSRSSRRTTGPSFRARSTGIGSTVASVASTSSRSRPGSTAKSRVPTGSTTRSTGCSTASSSMTPGWACKER
jgi:hypothetical protein